MALTQIEIEQFRCIRTAKLEFLPEQNLILGENAGGKTSILEAIFLLGSGHSFRTTATETLVQEGSDEFLVVGKLMGQTGQTVIGARGSKEVKEFRVNGEARRTSAELARMFPVQIIDPEVHRLLEDGPVRRRRFLDWGVFHVEPLFHDAWRRYNRALRQRNAALRGRSVGGDLDIWNLELEAHGSVIAELRDRYLATLGPFVSSIGHRLLGKEVVIDYQRGWRRESRLIDALKEAQVRDFVRGATSVGPHRAELILKVNGRPMKDGISRGQQKMLACTLLLAQQFQRISISAPSACLLLDDPAAELDLFNLGKLLEVIAELRVQLIVTSLSPEVLKVFNTAKVFHVEHGMIKGMA